MKKILLITTLAFILNTIIAQQSIVNYDINGTQRSSIIYIPSDYSDGDSWPLVINMHGLGSNASQQQFYSYFNNVADTSQFIVVYPNGLEADFGGVTQQQWDSYFGTGTAENDMAFLNHLIDDMHRVYNIDLTRVYSTGMSNGGFQSYRLACEMSDRIAAIGSVTGGVIQEQLNNCNNLEYIPSILQIHGTIDGTVPYQPIPTLVQYWREKHGCSEASIIIEYQDINTTDATTVTSENWQDCSSGGEVIFYTVDNGGHTWPGAFDVGIGNVNQDIKASNEIWEFFKKFQHPNPRSVLSNNKNIAVSTISVFPNPTSEQINISGFEGDQFVISDLIGNTIFAKSKNKILDVSHLNNGVYIIHSIDNPNQVSKFVIHH